MNVHRDEGAVSPWNLSNFLRRSVGLKSSMVYIIFRMPTQYSWSPLSPTRCAWTRLLSDLLPTQFTRYFLWGNICVLFTLGKGADPAMPPTQLMQHVKGIKIFTEGDHGCDGYDRGKWQRCHDFKSCYHSKYSFYPWEKFSIQLIFFYLWANSGTD